MQPVFSTLTGPLFWMTLVPCTQILSTLSVLDALKIAAGAAVPAARAQTVQRPARVIVGFPPGGSSDVVARLYAERLRGLGYVYVTLDLAGFRSGSMNLALKAHDTGA